MGPTFSTVRSNGQFDPSKWESLVQKVGRHFTIEPDSNSQFTLPNDFILFAPDIPKHGGPIGGRIHQPSLQAHPNNYGKSPAPVTTQQTPSMPRQTPTPSTPAPVPIPVLPTPTSALAPAPALPAAPPTIFQPRRFTRINFGLPPDVLDPSGHVITQYTEATNPISAPYNTSLVQHYCNTMGIRLPSGRYSRTPTKRGPKRLLYNVKDVHAKIHCSRLSSLYLASLK